MSQPFVGEIRMFGGNFAPAGWHFCNGALLSISENEVLFLLIGTTYGGDGQSTFGVPDLRGRVPIHIGQGAGLSSRVIGEAGGTETVTLTANQIPVHNHAVGADTRAGTSTKPQGRVWSASAPSLTYAAPTGVNTTTLNPATVAASGGSQPHENMLPFVAVNFIISLFGIFPSQA